MKPLSSFFGWKSRTAMKHIVMSIYAQCYEVTFLVDMFLKPITHDLIVRIDYHRFYSTDGHFYWEESTGGLDHESSSVNIWTPIFANYY
jgi:hypothetical protein